MKIDFRSTIRGDALTEREWAILATDEAQAIADDYCRRMLAKMRQYQARTDFPAEAMEVE